MKTEININALYIDKNFKIWLDMVSDDIKIAQIHSVFDKVINVEDDSGDLYSISNSYTDKAPYTLKTDYNFSFKDKIEKGQALFKSGNMLTTSTLKIDVSKAKLEDMKLMKIKKYNESIIKYNLASIYDLISNIGNAGGCKYYFMKNLLNIENSMPTSIEKELSLRIEKFYNAFTFSGIKKEDILKLVGLGIGLTPSGDDFLTGFLGAVYIFEKNSTKFDIISNILNIEELSTNDISKAMLRAVINGQIREYLADFIYAVFEEDNINLTNKFENLMKVGSSSGTDMSIGVVLGFLSTLEKR